MQKTFPMQKLNLKSLLNVSRKNFLSFLKTSPGLPRNLFRNSGSALLYVILVVGLLSALITGFIVKTKEYVNRAGYLENRAKAYYIAKSGISLSKYLISEYNANVLEQNILFKDMSLYQNSYPLFGGAIKLFVYPQGTKFNINMLIYADGSVNETLYGELQKLFYVLGLPQALLNGIENFMLKHSLSYNNLSSNFTKYVNIKTSLNTVMAAGEPQLESGTYKVPFLSIRDLMLVPGMKYKYYYILKNFLCVDSSGLININYAPYQVVYALSPLISVSDAKELVNYRINNPIISVADIANVPGFNESNLTAMSSLIELASAYYKIKAEGYYRGARASITSLYYFVGGNTEKLYERPR